jgi:hypothetical protein
LSYIVRKSSTIYENYVEIREGRDNDFSLPPEMNGGILTSAATLLATTIYHGNPDRNHNLWNIVSTEKYIIHINP